MNDTVNESKIVAWTTAATRTTTHSGIMGNYPSLGSKGGEVVGAFGGQCVADLGQG